MNHQKINRSEKRVDSDSERTIIN